MGGDTTGRRGGGKERERQTASLFKVNRNDQASKTCTHSFPSMPRAHPRCMNPHRWTRR